MFPEELMQVISKYKSSNQTQIRNIYNNLCEIITSLKSVKNNMASDLYRIITSDDMIDSTEILNDVNLLKEQISYIESFTFSQSNNTKEIAAKEDFDFENTNIILNKDNYNTIPPIDIYTVIVLSNTLKCSSNHKIKDIVAKLPVLNEYGQISYISVNAAYCSTCNRFTILKDDFNAIKDIITCKVVDETASYFDNDNSFEIEIEQKHSILAQYGYNVQTKKDLSEQQRQIILSSIIEAQILTRREVIDHITTLIERGSKIPNWKYATQKWKDDKRFVSEYQNDCLPEVVFNNIILKYRKLN